MSRFRDEYAPEDMPSWPCASAPRFSTQIAQADSGVEQVNQRWEHPLYRFMMPEVIRLHSTFAAVRDQWLIMRGPAYTWPWQDPLDFASVELPAPTIVPPISMLDQAVGNGDGVTRTFQLLKTYTVGSFTYVRTIHLPVTSAMLVGKDIDGGFVIATTPVAIDGIASPIAYTISRPGGIITFATAPAPGAQITAGFYFDNEVRFEDDDVFEGIVQSYAVSGFASLTLIEVRPCEGGSL